MVANNSTFAQWFRASAPYIHSFRGRIFVIAFGGEVVAHPQFIDIVHDFNLLHSLGIRLVLVHGARPQIEESLTKQQQESRYAQNLRITDLETLNIVLEATGRVRFEIEALLSMGIATSPMAGAQIRIGGGNFVAAQPVGVRDGVDFLLTGTVRKIDAPGLQQRLASGEIALLSALGNSPTGEIFNLALEDVATETAIALGAAKLIFLTDSDGAHDSEGQLCTELSTVEATELLRAKTLQHQDLELYLPGAIKACKQGVRRSHLVNWQKDGALLMELFTRDGVGTMVHLQGLEKLRPATIDDIGGVLAIIEPLEEEGTLVRRSRELLEMEISRFWVVEYDGSIIGCSALYTFPDERKAELASLAVHPDFRREGYGEALLNEIEQQAKRQKIETLFVLTTRTAHWFLERGFQRGTIEDLPKRKKALYNYQRKSQVYYKIIR